LREKRNVEKTPARFGGLDQTTKKKRKEIKKTLIKDPLHALLSRCNKGQRNKIREKHPR